MITITPTTSRRKRIDIEDCLIALAEVFGNEKDLVEIITLVLVEDHAITWNQREEIIQALSAQEIITKNED